MIRRMGQKLRTETGETHWNRAHRLTSYSWELENSFSRNFSTTNTMPPKKFWKWPWHFHQIKSNQTIKLSSYSFSNTQQIEQKNHESYVFLHFMPFLFFSFFTFHMYTLVLVVKDIWSFFCGIKIVYLLARSKSEDFAFQRPHFRARVTSQILRQEHRVSQ